MLDKIWFNELIDRMNNESITYRIDMCSLGEQFKICLPMKNNFVEKLDISIVFYENGNLEYKAKVPVIFDENILYRALSVVNEMNGHNQITSYCLEEKSVVTAKYIIKTNGVFKVSTDYVLSIAFHFAATIDDSLCKILTDSKDGKFSVIW